MGTQNETRRVGAWLVEPDLLQVRDGETTHRLEPKAMRLLLFLAEKAPNVVSREEIFEVIWDGRTVVDETLTRSVYLLRQALGDDAKKPRYIETIPTRGYRLIADVERSPAQDSPALANARRPWLLLALLAMIVVAVLAARPWRDRPAASSKTVRAETRPTIAVLPFENLSGEATDLYLSEGLTDELIHQLAGIGGLKVVSRTSSMRVRDTDETESTIARKLGVEFLLKGSILVVEDQARISARLVGVDRDEHLFSRTYDRDLEGILDLLRAVASDVAIETQVLLTAREQRRLDVVATVDPEAYRLYLQGLHAVRRRTPDDFRLALTWLRQAVERAPTFALAWSSLADAQLLSVQYQLDDSSLEEARVTIETALALDPDQPQAHAALGLLYVLRDHDWDKAEAAYRQALALGPSDATAHRRYSEMLALAGRYQEAVDQAKLAVDLDPLSPLAHATYGHRLSSVKRYSDAIRELETADELGAKFVWHLRELSHARTRIGDEVGAAAARRQDIARQGANEEDLAVLDQAIAEDGLAGYWVWRRQRLSEAPAPVPFQVAEAAAALDKTDEALAYLAKTIETDLVWFLHGQRSPALDRLRDDPRYLELVRGLPQWRP